MSLLSVETIVEAMQHGIVVRDPSGKCVLCNRRALELTGRTFEQMTALEVLDPPGYEHIRDDGSVIAFEDLPSVVAMRTRAPHQLEVGIRTPSGTRWQIVSAVPVLAAGSAELEGVVTTIVDISDRRQSELELRRSNALQSAIMASDLNAIFTLDSAGRIVNSSETSRAMYRLEGPVSGRPMADFVPPRDLPVWEQMLDRARVDPAYFQGRRIEGTGRRGDGTEFPLEVSLSMIDANDEQLLIAFVRDVTDRKEYERRLADARDAALRASVAKSEFLATMSHEIRTPMNGVIGSLDLILDSSIAGELRELAQIARGSAHDLLAIINDILDLSKIEADKIERHEEEFNLAQLVEGVADVVALAARQKGLGLSTYIDPDLPETISGDPRLLRQVLVNLIGNAVKFTDSGEVTIRAELEPAGTAQAIVRFTVHDTGIGMPEDALETLFDPFTQVDGGTKRAQGGTGLGLAISARLVRLLGGRLAVETKLGEGSTFHFTLPFALPEVPAEVRALPTRSGRPLRVLMMEASDSSAETLERYLRAWGMVTTRVSEAAAAAERFAQAPSGERFDVVIIAPPPGGTDTLAQLAEQLRRHAGSDGVFLIALVDVAARLISDNGGADAPATKALGVDAVVGKPLKQSRLFDALASAVSGAAAPEPAARKDELTELRGLHVLLAEDNPVNKQVLIRQAARLGIEVDAVENGQQALDALIEAGERYDAVLMDCQMPVMDGYEATRSIRRREQAERLRRMPIVAVTANAMREDFERCRDAGMDDFVAKPVTLAALSNAIERAIVSVREQDDAAPEPEQAESGPELDPYGIDRAALTALQDDVGGPAALQRIVRLFLEQLEPQSEQIVGAADSGDHENLARNAHRMRSSSATLGAHTLAEILGKLEVAAREADAAACSALAALLVEAVERVREAFESLIDDLDEAITVD